MLYVEVGLRVCVKWRSESYAYRRFSGSIAQCKKVGNSALSPTATHAAVLLEIGITFHTIIVPKLCDVRVSNGVKYYCHGQVLGIVLEAWRARQGRNGT